MYTQEQLSEELYQLALEGSKIPFNQRFKDGVDFLQSTIDVMKKVQAADSVLRMSYWIQKPIDLKVSEPKSVSMHEFMHTCGTAACVIGYCVTDRDFVKKSGMYPQNLETPKMLPDYNGDEDVGEYFSFYDKESSELCRLSEVLIEALFAPDAFERQTVLNDWIEEENVSYNIAKELKSFNHFKDDVKETPENYIKVAEYLIEQSLSSNIDLLGSAES